MKVGEVEFVEDDGSVRYQAVVETAFGVRPLWYAVDAEHAELLSSRSDAALVALLLPAMASGEDIYLAGTVSDRLYYNLSGALQNVLRLIIPRLHLVGIHPCAVEPAPPPASGVATGFSAGIDSFCALADHFYREDVPVGFRLTHLLYNNVGSHGRGEEKLFLERYSRLLPVAQRSGLPFVAINSNLNEFYGRLYFQQTHTIRNASVALLVQAGIGRFMYASSMDYAHVFIGPSHDTGFSDPVTLPLLSTTAVDLISVGSEYTRVEKTLRVANLEDSFDSLEVCVSSARAGNCSRCKKCLRTLLTLEVAGQLDRYARVFDLEVYRRNRTAYIAQVLAERKSPLLMELAAFVRDANLPFASRVQARLRWPLAKKQIERVRGKLRRQIAQLSA